VLWSPDTDPVILQQGIYRALLSALSRPGEMCRLPGGCGPDPRGQARGIFETLLDHEVTFAVAENLNPRLTAADIVRWTHAREAPLATADFLIVEGPGSNGQVAGLKRGTAEMPDQGATVIYLLPQPPATRSSSATVSVSGPGIAPPGKRTFPALDIAKAEWLAIREANREFPMGIDCFFVAPNATVVGLPRSVRIEEVA
jgi:alpha-D-ribose 1-methylphosphonate 5-triphosphate synthase subunit PhnH